MVAAPKQTKKASPYGALPDKASDSEDEKGFSSSEKDQSDDKLHKDEASEKNSESMTQKGNVQQELAPLKLLGFVGIANLPAQYHRHSMQRGFSLNLMVAGSSGLGKSTLINTLFNTNVFGPAGGARDVEPGKTIEIRKYSSSICENGVELRLNVVDTPGLGDRINNEGCWKQILHYIESRFDNYLDAESGPNRSKIVDERVHALLYFIEPTGHSLSQLDIEIMKRLHKKVNLIPLIAKSDLLNEEELAIFKKRILADLKHFQIQVYEIPTHESDDEETRAETLELQNKFPYAVVGSSHTIEYNGKSVRGRAYPWGSVCVDDPTHSDFVTLKQLLIRTHMEDLKERTSNVLYEQYRTDRLVRQGVTQDQTAFRTANPQEKLAEQRAAQEQRLAKLEAEMRQVFEQKVREKEEKLKQSEEELYARHKDMKDSLEQQRLELEDKKSRIESEKQRIGSLEGSERIKKKGFSLKN